jgi:hypothetical protein
MKDQDLRICFIDDSCVHTKHYNMVSPITAHGLQKCRSYRTDGWQFRTHLESSRKYRSAGRSDGRSYARCRQPTTRLGP